MIQTPGLVGTFMASIIYCLSAASGYFLHQTNAPGSIFIAVVANVGIFRIAFAHLHRIG